MEKSISKRVIGAAVASVLGVALLSLDSVGGAFSWRGDGLILGVACAAAAYILRSKQISEHVPMQPLATTKCIGQFVFAFLYFVLVTPPSVYKSINMSALFAGATLNGIFINIFLVLWTGIVVSYGSTVLQLWGQKMVSASEAVVVFASMPVWAACMAIPLGERFGLQGFLGAGLILGATVAAGLSGAKAKAKAKG